MNMDAAEIIEHANALKSHLLAAIQKVSVNTSRMKVLDDAGRIYATPHWRDGKYLYLLHPGRDQDGKRVREYIGANSDRIKETLQKVENARQFDELDRQTRWASQELERVSWQMQTLITDLERMAPRPSGDTDGVPGRAPVTNALDSAVVTDPLNLELQASPIEESHHVHIR